MAVRQRKGQGEPDEENASTLDVFLLGICTTCALCTEPSEVAGLASSLMAEMLSLRHEVASEPDSMAKFLVSAP